MEKTGGPSEEKIVRRIDQIRSRGHLPGGLIDLLQAVYLRQCRARAEAAIALPAETELTGTARHDQGVPLLPRSCFCFDAGQTKTLFAEFLELLKTGGSSMAQAAETVEDALRRGDLSVEACFSAHLSADESFFTLFGATTPAAPRALNFLTQSAMAPSLALCAEALFGKHRLDLTWPYPSCPICGSLPLIGYLKERSGAKRLTCSFCRTDYRAPRMFCALCGEKDHHKLSYFSAEQEPGYRVDVCSTCRKYLKTADFREMDRQPFPLLDDLDSLALDFLAVREGYARATLSGFGF